MVKYAWRGRRLRLRRELETIRGAVEAARILGEAMATSQLGPERDHRRAPRALTSLLSLVERRLREVRSAARKGGGEPRRVHARGSDDGSRMSLDEWMLARCAMAQRTGGGWRFGYRLI